MSLYGGRGSADGQAGSLILSGVRFRRARPVAAAGRGRLDAAAERRETGAEGRGAAAVGRGGGGRGDGGGQPFISGDVTVDIVLQHAHALLVLVLVAPRARDGQTLVPLVRQAISEGQVHGVDLLLRQLRVVDLGGGRGGSGRGGRGGGGGQRAATRGLGRRCAQGHRGRGARGELTALRGVPPHAAAAGAPASRRRRAPRGAHLRRPVHFRGAPSALQCDLLAVPRLLCVEDPVDESHGCNLSLVPATSLPERQRSHVHQQLFGKTWGQALFLPEVEVTGNSAESPRPVCSRHVPHEEVLNPELQFVFEVCSSPPCSVNDSRLSLERLRFLTFHS